jgi:hypothetical protein
MYETKSMLINHQHENETEVARRLMQNHLYPINHLAYQPLQPIA